MYMYIYIYCICIYICCMYIYLYIYCIYICIMHVQIYKITIIWKSVQIWFFWFSNESSDVSQPIPPVPLARRLPATAAIPQLCTSCRLDLGTVDMPAADGNYWDYIFAIYQLVQEFATIHNVCYSVNKTMSLRRTKNRKLLQHPGGMDEFEERRLKVHGGSKKKKR